MCSLTVPVILTEGVCFFRKEKERYYFCIRNAQDCGLLFLTCKLY